MTHSTGFHLHLVRHGESSNNALPEHQRVPDPALTDLGHRQASQLGQYYRNAERIDFILASPFRRTLQTATPLLSERNMQATIWTDLYEVGGCFSGHEPNSLKGEAGMTAEQLRAEFPRFDVPDDIDHRGWYKSKPFETWDIAIPRAREQAHKLHSTFGHLETVVFCFIHADFKQLLLQQLLPHHPDYHGGGIPNTSVTHIRFNNGEAQVMNYLNTNHLGSDELSY